MGLAIAYGLVNLAVLGLFFYVTYRMTKKIDNQHALAKHQKNIFLNAYI
tara:strand:+ start:761 stop:907 length:147 start_codon:yes stop_codon:yes gene_type:complete